MVAPWIGGASAPAAAPIQAGYRGLLAFWMGGASSPAVTIGGSGAGGGAARRSRAPDVRGKPALDSSYQDDDDAIIQTIIAWVTLNG